MLARYWLYGPVSVCHKSVLSSLYRELSDLVIRYDNCFLTCSTPLFNCLVRSGIRTHIQYTYGFLGPPSPQATSSGI